MTDSLLVDAPPPHHRAAEQTCLGSVLLDDARLPEVLSILRPDDFYVPAHAIVFEAATRIFQAGRRLALETLVGELRARDELGKVGGVEYLVTLMETVPNSSHATELALLVAESAERRLAYQGALKIAAEARRVVSVGARPIAETISQVATEVGAVRERRQGGAVQVRDRVQGVLDRILEPPAEVRGVPTGFYDVDRMLHRGGFAPGSFNVVAGRPSMGKSSFAANVASYVALTLGRPVGFITLEVTADDLIENMLAAHSRVSLNRMAEGLTDDEATRVIESSEALYAADFRIADRPHTDDDIRLRMLRWATRDPPALVVVDYIQLVRATGRHESRQQEMTTVSATLKGAAQETGIPILAVSQLSRAVESREDKRPRMSDLRESGAIEQDADVVALLYRDDYYADRRDSAPPTGEAEVIVAKNRRGSTGVVHLYFAQTQVAFRNRSRTGFEPPDAM